MSGGDTRLLAMVIPITFLSNSLGAAGFIKVYVCLYMLHCNSQINGALFIMECKGTRNTYFYLIIFINCYTGLLFCQGEQVKTGQWPNCYQKQLTEV